jgi:hypothetical protein
LKVDFAFLCDYAEAAVKLNALGIGFDTIYSQRIPCMHPHFSLVFQLRSSVVEAGQKDVEIHLIDEDGTDVAKPIQRPITIPRGNTAEVIGRVVMEFVNIEFKRYGSYSVRVAIDRNEVIELIFRVVPAPAGTPQPG